MKKIISNLEKQFKLLNNLVQQREDYVLERSEKWQESEMCEEYEYKTMDIDSVGNDLDCVIDELKNLL